MSYSLDDLVGDIRASLSKSAIDACAKDVCGHVSKALLDPDFVSEHLPDRVGKQQPRAVLWEDRDLGFCVCGHVYAGPAESGPHDHGPSWAIYGQAEGQTEMTDWQIVKPGNGADASLVEADQTYTLNPGDAHFYDVGAVHSPKRSGPTRLLRIEGANLDNVTRSNIEKA